MKRVLSDQFDKLSRAESLLSEFGREAQAYIDKLAVKMVAEKDETDLIHVKIKTDTPVPKTAAIIASEIIYHARSVLDQMVVEVGKQNGLNDTDHLYFPFAGSKVEFEAKGTQKKMRGLPADVCDLLSDMKPYANGNKKLWGLSRLANVDKHQMLIPFLPGGGITGMENIKIDGGGHPNSLTLLISDGDLIEGVTLSKIGPKGSFEYKELKFTVWVAFNMSIPVFGGTRAVLALRDMLHLSRGILESVSAHCFGE